MTTSDPRGRSLHGTSLKDAHDAAASRTSRIRLSEGLEDTTDLIAELRQSLDAVIS